MGVKHHGVCVSVECSKQTQKSRTKNRGVGVEHGGACVWNVRKKTQNSKTKNRGVCVECSKQTQNSETKNRRVGVKHLCVWNVQNKPKTYTITARLPKSTGDDIRIRNIRAAENYWPAGQDLEGSRSMTIE